MRSMMNLTAKKVLANSSPRKVQHYFAIVSHLSAYVQKPRARLLTWRMVCSDLKLHPRPAYWLAKGTQPHPNSLFHQTDSSVSISMAFPFTYGTLVARGAWKSYIREPRAQEKQFPWSGLISHTWSVYGRCEIRCKSWPSSTAVSGRSSTSAGNHLGTQSSSACRRTDIIIVDR